MCFCAMVYTIHLVQMNIGANEWLVVVVEFDPWQVKGTQMCPLLVVVSPCFRENVGDL